MSELEALAVANIQVPGRSWLVEGQSMRNSWHPAMVARGIVTANGETVPICLAFNLSMEEVQSMGEWHSHHQSSG